MKNTLTPNTPGMYRFSYGADNLYAYVPEPDRVPAKLYVFDEDGNPKQIKTIRPVNSEEFHHDSILPWKDFHPKYGPTYFGIQPTRRVEIDGMLDSPEFDKMSLIISGMEESNIMYRQCVFCFPYHADKDLVLYTYRPSTTDYWDVEFV